MQVYSYAQMSQIFIPQTGLRKRWEATDLVRTLLWLLCYAHCACVLCFVVLLCAVLCVSSTAY